MKISSVIVQPPSLVAQLEGKVNKAFNLKVKELNQKALENKENAKNDDINKTQNLIDLLA